jgi:hypothetical protein
MNALWQRDKKQLFGGLAGSMLWQPGGSSGRWKQWKVEAVKVEADARG